MEVLKLLLKGGFITVCCVALNHMLKFAIALLICRHPELSNKKVKYLTRMITKDTKYFDI